VARRRPSNTVSPRGQAGGPPFLRSTDHHPGETGTCPRELTCRRDFDHRVGTKPERRAEAGIASKRGGRRRARLQHRDAYGDGRSAHPPVAESFHERSPPASIGFRPRTSTIPTTITPSGNLTGPRPITVHQRHRQRFPSAWWRPLCLLRTTGPAPGPARRALDPSGSVTPHRRPAFPGDGGLAIVLDRMSTRGGRKGQLPQLNTHPGGPAPPPTNAGPPNTPWLATPRRSPFTPSRNILGSVRNRACPTGGPTEFHAHPTRSSVSNRPAPDSRTANDLQRQRAGKRSPASTATAARPTGGAPAGKSNGSTRKNKEAETTPSNNSPSTSHHAGPCGPHRSNHQP